MFVKYFVTSQNSLFEIFTSDKDVIFFEVEAQQMLTEIHSKLFLSLLLL